MINCSFSVWAGYLRNHVCRKPSGPETSGGQDASWVSGQRPKDFFDFFRKRLDAVKGSINVQEDRKNRTANVDITAIDPKGVIIPMNSHMIYKMQRGSDLQIQFWRPDDDRKQQGRFVWITGDDWYNNTRSGHD